MLKTTYVVPTADRVNSGENKQAYYTVIYYIIAAVFLLLVCVGGAARPRTRFASGRFLRRRRRSHLAVCGGRGVDECKLLVSSLLVTRQW